MPLCVNRPGRLFNQSLLTHAYSIVHVFMQTQGHWIDGLHNIFIHYIHYRQAQTLQWAHTFGFSSLCWVSVSHIQINSTEKKIITFQLIPTAFKKKRQAFTLLVQTALNGTLFNLTFGFRYKIDHEHSSQSLSNYMLDKYDINVIKWGISKHTVEFAHC